MKFCKKSFAQKKPNKNKDQYQIKKRKLSSSIRDKKDNKRYFAESQNQNYLTKEERSKNAIFILSFTIISLLFLTGCELFQANKNSETKFQSETNYIATISALKSTLSASDETRVADGKKLDELILSITERANKPIESYDETETPSSQSISPITSTTPPTTSEDTPSPIPTSTPSPSSTHTYTPTLRVIFEEDFSENIKNWDELNYGQDGVNVYSKFLKNEFLIYVINENSPDYFFTQHFPIKNVEVRDFCLSLDLKAEISDKNNTAFGISYRFQNSTYYLIRFFTNGTFSMKLIDMKHNPSLINKGEHYFPLHNEDFNNYRICVKDDSTFIFVNNIKITQLSDGGVNQKGKILLSIVVPKGNSATIKIDNLLITDFYDSN